MKYVIYNGDNFVIFPDFQAHDTFKSLNPTSAGFCQIESLRDSFGEIKYKVRCYGKSDSLKLVSRGEEDSFILATGMR